MTFRRYAGIVMVSALGATLVSVASSYGQSQGQSHAKIELMAEENGMAPRKPLWTGIKFQLDEGWHIYWQNAGDSGEPPKIEWRLPAGFTAGATQWPQPVRLGAGSIVDYGYEGEVLLMTPIDGPARPEARAIPSISALVKYVVCREICVPGKADVTLSLPYTSDIAQRRTLFERARTQLPKPAPASWRVSAISDQDHFTLSVQTDSQVQSATFFPSEPGEIENSAVQSFVSNANGFRLTLQKSNQLTKPISVLRGLVVLGPGRAYEVAAPVVAR
jgi:DsbC/DsbD-like thiol-disulfide interchange protein